MLKQYVRKVLGYLNCPIQMSADITDCEKCEHGAGSLQRSSSVVSKASLSNVNVAHSGDVIFDLWTGCDGGSCGVVLVREWEGKRKRLEGSVWLEELYTVGERTGKGEGME